MQTQTDEQAGLKSKAERYRRRVREFVRQHGLVGAMNNTKWRELRGAMDEWENAPAYEIKYLFDEISEAEVEQAIVETTVAIGDWGDEHFYPMFDIEWVKIRKLRSVFRGHLIAPEIVDNSAGIRAILERFSIPYVENEFCFTVYGYLKGYSEPT
ncbi:MULTISPECIES: DUF6678 family protein [Eikenella]|uniref:Uncharacterized protein n=1 Tax=Eikenella longinqua TaxID=1795827 RepID=A0A1A9RYC2_9NEIS|nr:MULTISPECIES: DUF6678 family protein [Eikenella]OAM29151.1 hypothetical protein A7P95_04150 [Eikenella longinqua]